MKTTEMIEVMKAFEDGKKIECASKNQNDWGMAKKPCWNWDRYDYRVKEEPKYRPYKDTEEMINDFCNRFRVKRTSFGEPFIWIRLKVNTTSKHIITDTYIDGVSLSSDYIDLDTLFNNYTYLNGSPCGIKE